jgi:hypothetical protein
MKIDLSKILDEHCTTTYNKLTGEEEIIASKEAVIIAMTEACYRVIELCAESARTEEPLRNTESMSWNNVSKNDYVFFKPDKGSILGVKKLVG